MKILVYVRENVVFKLLNSSTQLRADVYTLYRKANKKGFTRGSRMKC